MTKVEAIVVRDRVETVMDAVEEHTGHVGVTVIEATGHQQPLDAILGGPPRLLAEVRGARTDIVVLACTHYPFLTDIFTELAPWPVTWLDPAPAIAKQVGRLLKAGGMRNLSGSKGAIKFYTSGDPVSLKSMLPVLLGELGMVERVIWSNDSHIEQN